VPKNFSNEHPQILLFADLGQSVLDEAVVETCCYISGWQRLASIAFRNLRRVPRLFVGSSLAEDTDGFIWKPLFFFNRIPMRQMFYGLSGEQVAQLNSNAKLEPCVGRVTKGLSTCSDERFVRCFWEVSPAEPYKRWFPLARAFTVMVFPLAQ